MLLGYVEFVALLLVPGAAVLEIFRPGAGLSLAERLGLAFGLSMGVDVLALAFRTSGLLIGSQLMRGVFPGTLELILGASIVAFLVPVVVRRRLSFSLPSRYDLYVFALVLGQAALVAAHFYKYPVFPQFPSVDFSQHVEITADLQSGRATLLPGGLLYYGAHLLMASLVALSGDLVLLATQYAMGILVALSPLLVFVSISSLTGNRRVALLSTLAYVVTGFVWFGSVFNAGLYPNFYGILSILLLFAVVPLALKEPRRLGVWVALVIAVGSGYLSHYSYVTVIPAVAALPVAKLVLERKANLPSLAAAMVLIVPAAVAVAARPGLVSLMLQFAQSSGGGSIGGDTALSSYLAGWPVLRYAVVEIADDAGAVAALALGAFGVYLAVKGKSPLVWMLVVWLASLLAVAPFSEGAWRFSYMTLLPLLVFAAITLEWLIPRGEERTMRQRSKMRYRRDWTRYRLAAVGVALLLLSVDSWSWQLVGDAASNGAANNETQHGILTAMAWMDSNTPSGSLVVSVTSSYFNYYQLLYGRESGYQKLANPNDVVFASGNSTSPTYVVVTKVATFAMPPAEQNPYYLFQNDTRFRLAYNQTGVLVYQLKG